jgi:hypothetical protein
MSKEAWVAIVVLVAMLLAFFVYQSQPSDTERFLNDLINN